MTIDTAKLRDKWESPRFHPETESEAELQEEILAICDELDAAKEELSAYREEAMGGDSVWSLLLQARADVLRLRDDLDQNGAEYYERDYTRYAKALTDTEHYEQYQ